MTSLFLQESLSISPSDSMRLIASPDFSSTESIPIAKTGVSHLLDVVYWLTSPLKSIYNLPNEHILIESPSNVSKPEVEVCVFTALSDHLFTDDICSIMRTTFSRKIMTQEASRLCLACIKLGAPSPKV